MFEFGSGHSTLFYSARVQRIVAVEHDKEWFEILSRRAGPNVTLLFRPSQDTEVGKLEYAELTEYVSPLLDQPESSLDVVVIDGVERVTCATVAASRLKEDGIIIFDNSDRPLYRPGIEHLHRQGYGRIDFYGLVPGYGTFGCTSIFGHFTSRWTEESPLAFQGF